jgi:CHASE2 domain-containing sensor protein
MQANDPNPSLPNQRQVQTRPSRMSLPKRILRSLPAIVILLVLVWIFGRVGVLHKLETIVMDMKMQLSQAPPESPVAIVNINDDDYWKLFSGTSPLEPARLKEILNDIAKGDPAVIAVDIDTSGRQFKNALTVENGNSHIVWEREVRELPEDTAEKEKLEPLDVLGGTDLDPSKNSVGLAILIDDGEDKVTRRYSRLIRTSVDDLPSFPWSVAKAFNPIEVAKLHESVDDLLINYHGDRAGHHRVTMTASKVLELVGTWPTASPFRRGIVLVGGSYLGQDRHDTPIGRLTGVEILANVIETELGGGGDKPPRKRVLFALEIFEAFVLVAVFHACRFPVALLISLLLIPMVSPFCSWLAFGDWFHVWHFAPILLGLILFESYEHYRRTAVPRLYHDIVGNK